MSDINWKEIYPNGLDAEICEGYYDGRRLDIQNPSSNRHPAYVHGFMNGRDDLCGRPRKSAQEIRSDIAYIESVEGATPQ